MATPSGEINFAEMDIAAANNNDGFGYAFVKKVRNGGPRVIVRKRRHYSELKAQFQADYVRYRTRSPFLIHFRWATQGVIADRTAHPFHLRDGGAMIHNGIIDMPVTRKGQSDTEAFVAKFINRLPIGWEENTTMITAVERMVETGNKLCFIWPDKEFLIVGEEYGTWENGVWYSNDSHKRRRYYTYAPGDDDVIPYSDWLQNRRSYYATNDEGKDVTFAPGSNHVHSALCECQSCERYDMVDPEAEARFTAWVIETLTKRAHDLGGETCEWSSPSGYNSSLVSLIIKTKGGGLLPPGVYVATKNSIYTVPEELHDAPSKEIFLWYLKAPGLGEPYSEEKKTVAIQVTT